jgi:hypothetical protein
MTVRRIDDAILLEGVCAVEDAEILMEQVEAGGSLFDSSDCTHLHTACLQVILATGLPMRGTPANAALARWLAPLIRSGIATTAGATAAQVPNRDRKKA